LEQSLTAVDKVSSLNNEVAAASEEQSTGIEQINKAIAQMNQATQANAANAEEAAAASEESSGQAESLREMVAELTRLVNGGSGHTGMPRRASQSAHPRSVTSNHAGSKNFSMKTPQKFQRFPLDDDESLGSF
jgi:DNA helicase HerA-like ATPase